VIAQKKDPYWDRTLDSRSRAADLLARMTLQEKIVQLGSFWVYELLKPEKWAQQMPNGIGHLTRLLGASAMTPTEGARFANKLQRFLLEETRLGIPALIHEECCSGYMGRDATCFPQAIGVASTFQPELAEQMADVVRVQMRAAGAHQGLSPVLDVCRDPRWGRLEETYGEDPYLVASMGTAFVRGLQGKNLREGIVATGKHFVGYGMPEGGFNWAPPHLMPRELREVYLYPFEAAVREAGLQSMMNGYHELDGVPCGANYELLTGILRDQWGFDGVVVSDYFAIAQLHDFHHIVRTYPEAAALALNAGLDVELPNTNCFGVPLEQALQKELVSAEVVDLSVLRLLTMKFELGLFENPYVDEGHVAELFDNKEQRALAREIARQSIVLLKNDGVLPLPKTKRIALIGPSADDTRNMVGDYAYPCHIETILESIRRGNVFGQPVPAGVDEFEVVEEFISIHSFREVLEAELGAGRVAYARGCGILDSSLEGIPAAVELARQAEVAVLFVGDRAGLTDPCTTGEARDRATLGLPGVQEQLVQAVIDTGTPTVVVLVTGRPAAIPEIVERAAAVLEVWLPGEEGAEAVVDALLGSLNPGGKLAVTVPRHVGQVPTHYGHKPSGGRSQWKMEYVEMSNKPLFPFGFGLSYTTFALDDFRIDRREAKAGERFTVTIDVTNTGSRTGDEVVQLYLRYEGTSVTRPVKELRGFKRVTLAPGERRTVRFVVSVDQAAFLDREMNLVIESTELQIFVGTSSENLPHRAAIDIIGEKCEVERVFFSEVQVI